jgi:hypothetical protein
MRSGYSQGQGQGQGHYDQNSPSDFAFKVTDKEGNTHRIRSSADSLFLLKMAVGEKLNVLSSSLIVRYLDDEKDAVIISSDSSLRDAVEYARSAGMPALRLTITVAPSSTPSTPVRAFGSARGGSERGSVTEESIVPAADTMLESLLSSPKKAREAMAKVNKSTWLMGGALTAVAGIALGGIALLKGNQK